MSERWYSSERSGNPASTSGRGAALKPSTRAPGPASRKKTVRFNSTELSKPERTAVEAESLPSKPYRAEDAESLDGVPHGNEALSSIFGPV